MKKLCTILSLVLVLSFLVGSVSAESRASDVIAAYHANIDITSSNDLFVSFDITASGIMSVVGINMVQIQKKVSGTWYEVETYDYHTNPELRTTNALRHYASITYDNPQAGYDYRACITFYASNGTTSDSRTIYTASVRR